jgi:hypothetical protein
MTKYHAVMLDETRCEFGVTIEAENKEEARKILREDYPESRCVQLESPEDTRERERLMWQRIQEEEDGYFRPDDEEEWS